MSFHVSRSVIVESPEPDKPLVQDVIM